MLVITGCNVLDAAYEEGGSVENSIEDAQHARANGDLPRAEELLRDALEQEPGNAVVRTELSSTLLQRDSISFLSLEGVTTHILDELEAAGGGAVRGAASRSAASRGGASADSCTWNSTEPTRPFDPSAVDDYDAFVTAAATLAEVLGLLNDAATPAEGPVIPAELGEIDVCSVVRDGELAYDRDALLGAMRARFGGNDRQVNAVLKMNAIALTLGTYVDLFESDAFPVAWYIVGEEEDVRLGFCMDRANIDPFYQRVDGNLDALAEAFFSLDLLIYNTGDDEWREIVDEALELFVTFEESFGRFCAG